MTALAQGTAGVALVMGFALLCVQQISAASILLAVQSAAAAVAAVVLRQPLLAIPPVLLAGGTGSRRVFWTRSSRGRCQSAAPNGRSVPERRWRCYANRRPVSRCP